MLIFVETQIGERNFQLFRANVDRCALFVEVDAVDAGRIVEPVDTDHIAGLELHDAFDPGGIVAMLVLQGLGLVECGEGLSCGLLSGLVRIAAGAFGCAAGREGSGDGLLQGPLPAGQVLAGGADQCLGPPQARGDGDGVAVAGLADPEFVGGLQRLGVELDRGVVHAPLLEAHRLQCSKMRRHHGQTLPGEQVTDDGFSDGGTFVGVGAGAEFIQENQRRVLCSPEDVEAIRFALKHKGDIEALIATAPDVRVRQGQSVGAVWLLFDIARRLGITKALGSSREGKLALWQVIARIIDQGPRLSAVRLAGSQAACDVLDLDFFSRWEGRRVG